MDSSTRLLFGPEWDLKEWTASDDRVRGGSSVSNLTPTPDGALFHGTLDIETLGGAGFASQRTVAGDKKWDLSSHDGIELRIVSSDHKRYTFSLTDEIAPRRPDGREQSALVWEYDFCTNGKESTIRVTWKDLKPTYRGKPVKDARPLDVSQVKRFRIMARSFFGDQQGSFSLGIRSIALFRDNYLDNPKMTQETMCYDNEKAEQSDEQVRDSKKWSLPCCLF
ncbi:unnamed protein product [Penicillium olsonii]|uniref:NADH:ubiquinone oxidoreductase intermediate-associated protein 30 domain-containing protein n=1 Tax=Penicillium olsonii TaxID=99116 RepID=A0A9W4I0Z5_PENOL|nr:unnamed protein product [Penicillium olsonii]CAG8193547.1 unnamed protein product [Penicillium olsonii]CAG8239025.1 unnamed protein product [Penicillium olsonii]